MFKMIEHAFANNNKFINKTPLSKLALNDSVICVKSFRQPQVYFYIRLDFFDGK